MAASWIRETGLLSDVTYGCIVSLDDSEFIVASQHNKHNIKIKKMDVIY